jgi:hypothetical protein
VQTTPDTPVHGQASRLAVEVATQPDNRMDAGSVVQSRTATTAIALFRWHLGHDLTAAAHDAEMVLAEEAADKGLDPDRPRGLARSIILDS